MANNFEDCILCTSDRLEMEHFGGIGGSLSFSTLLHEVQGIQHDVKECPLKMVKKFIRQEDEQLFHGFQKNYDFNEACQIVINELSQINKKYQGRIIEENDLHLIESQLYEKEVLVSIHGLINVGKSTILNVFLRNQYLPVDVKPETAVTLRICDKSSNIMSQASFIKEKDDVLMEKDKIVAKGVDQIQKHLRQVNETTREQGLESAMYTLILGKPFSIKIPYGWKFTIVDSPGGNEAGCESVKKSVEESRAKSSAFIFVLTLDSCQSTESCKALKTLYETDKDIFNHARLTIVVNKIDMALFPSSGVKSRSIKEVKAEVCKHLYENVFDCRIPPEAVIVMSSYWANTARHFKQIQMSPETFDTDSDEELLQTIERDLQMAAFYFRNPPKKSELNPCKESTSENIAEFIEDQSHIIDFERRLEKIAMSSITIWKQKIKSDILQKVEIMIDCLKNKRQNFCIIIKELKDTIEGILKWVKKIKGVYEELLEDSSISAKQSSVWELLVQACRDDIKIRNVQERCWNIAVSRLESFKMSTMDKINNTQYQPQDLQTDLLKMSTNLAKNMDECINSFMNFKKMYGVYHELIANLKSKIADMSKTTVKKLELSHNRRDDTESEVFPYIPGPCADILSSTDIPPGQPNWIDKIVMAWKSFKRRFHRTSMPQSEDSLSEEEYTLTSSAASCNSSTHQDVASIDGTVMQLTGSAEASIFPPSSPSTNSGHSAVSQNRNIHHLRYETYYGGHEVKIYDNGNMSRPISQTSDNFSQKNISPLHVEGNYNSESIVPHHKHVDPISIGKEIAEKNTELDQTSESSSPQGFSSQKSRIIRYRRWSPELEQVFEDLKKKANKDISDYFDDIDSRIIEVYYNHYQKMAFSLLNEFDATMKEAFIEQKDNLVAKIKDLQEQEQKNEFCLFYITNIKLISAEFQAAIDRLQFV